MIVVSHLPAGPAKPNARHAIAAATMPSNYRVCAVPIRSRQPMSAGPSDRRSTTDIGGSAAAARITPRSPARRCQIGAQRIKASAAVAGEPALRITGGKLGFLSGRPLAKVGDQLVELCGIAGCVVPEVPGSAHVNQMRVNWAEPGLRPLDALLRPPVRLLRRILFLGLDCHSLARAERRRASSHQAAGLMRRRLGLVVAEQLLCGLFLQQATDLPSAGVVDLTRTPTALLSCLLACSGIKSTVTPRLSPAKASLGQGSNEAPSGMNQRSRELGGLPCHEQHAVPAAAGQPMPKPVSATTTPPAGSSARRLRTLVPRRRAFCRSAGRPCPVCRAAKHRLPSGRDRFASPPPARLRRPGLTAPPLCQTVWPGGGPGAAS